jgi:GNAT superfamily N-acetyltransferase
MSYDAVENSELAAIVTFLEMTKKPAIEIPACPLRLRSIANPEVSAYRELFRLVGAPWLWFSRLIMDDAKLAAIIQDHDVELSVVSESGGRDVGMLELDFREPGECELSFIGLIPELAGKGYGRWLLGEAVSRAWRAGVGRVHVHTCTLDHPAALPTYRRAGFTPYKRAIERFPDPRLLGFLPRDCAPQVPLLGTPG